MDRGVSIGPAVVALAWSTLAGIGCGGSSGASVKRSDAAVLDAGGVADVPLRAEAGAPDGAGLTSDGARDVPAIDAGRKLDAPWILAEAGDACRIDIAPISTTSLLSLTAGPTAVVRVQGTIVWGKTSPFPPTWKWTVTRSDGRAIDASPVELAPNQIQFPVSIAARYDIAVSIGPGCAGSAHALAEDPQSDFRIYRLRVIPPVDSEASRGAVPYEVDVKVAAGSPTIDKDVNLTAGVPIAIDPSTGPGSPITLAVPSYIRIQSSGSTWTTYGRSSVQTPLQALLDPALEYEILVVPDSSALDSQPWPPYILNRSTSDNVRVDTTYLATAADPLPLPRGIAISGNLRSPEGPVQNATINLHSYQASTTIEQDMVLFSTVGRADGYGAYGLWVNPAGMFSVVIMPPADSLLPIATIDQGIVLTDTSADIPRLDFTWAPLERTTLTATVSLPDGSPAPSGVTVNLEAEAGQLSQVGTLALLGTDADAGVTSTNWGATGLVRREGVTDRYGQVTFADLPKARYRIVLAPTGNLPGVAVTTVVVDVGSAGQTTPASIQLATKVVALGRLLDANGDSAIDAAGATITATDLGHDLTPPVVTTTVASDGTFYLVLDPHRTYSLSARPVQGRGLPSYVPLYGFSTGSTNLVLDDQRVPKGVRVRGHVGFRGQAVQGAVIQAFCIGLPPDCVDRNNLAAGAPPAYASATTDSNGSYGIYLPDPGVAE
jgi:hypothetical protein